MEENNQYIIHESTYGYYCGRSKKYGDMIEFASKEYAVKFPTFHEADSLVKKFNRRGYDMEVVAFK